MTLLARLFSLPLWYKRKYSLSTIWCALHRANLAPLEQARVHHIFTVQVIVEYCEEEDLLNDFIKLADEIEEVYPAVIVLGNPDGTEARKGAFEVSLGGKVLFSKLEVSHLEAS